MKTNFFFNLCNVQQSDNFPAVLFVNDHYMLFFSSFQIFFFLISQTRILVKSFKNISIGSTMFANYFKSHLKFCVVNEK